MNIQWLTIGIPLHNHKLINSNLKCEFQHYRANSTAETKLKLNQVRKVIPAHDVIWLMYTVVETKVPHQFEQAKEQIVVS